MKSLVGILALGFALTLCNITGKLPKRSDKVITGPKEEIVKARLTDLFDLCKADNKSEAAGYIMYRGSDQSRSGKDVARYENSADEKQNVDRTCDEIKTNLAQSGGYDFGKFMTQAKSDGSEVVAWEVYFRQDSMKKGQIYGFTLLNNKYVLVDLDSINEPKTATDIPPVRRGVVTVGPGTEGPIAPGSGTGIPGGVPQINDPPPPPAAAKKSITISGGVLNGKAISMPQPAYPAMAKSARASGQVTVQVLVSETGTVLSAHAASGHPLLQAAAVNAARQARFTPTRLSGQPVKVTGVIIYNFKLN